MLPDPKHFTDREAALAAYDALWQPGTGQRILNIEGLSGNGKTTLLWFLATHHDRNTRPRVTINLEQVRLRTEDHALLDALAQGFAPHLPPAALADYEVLCDRMDDEAAAIRRSALSAKVDISAEAGGTVSDSPVSVNAEMNLRLAEHQRMARTRLTRQLLRCLTTLAPNEAVLFVDTYEVVRQGQDAAFRVWFEEELVEALLAGLPHLRLVIGGREELPFRADRHRRERLREWQRQESDAFLASYDLNDPPLQEAIFKHCQGHPLLTDLARDVWQVGMEAGHRLTPDELRHDIDREAAAQWLFARLLERLAEPLRGAVRAAALLRHLSHERLNALLPEQQPLSYEQYQQLLRFSFVQRLPGQPPQVHDLIRQTEDSYNRANEPTRYRELHQRALAYHATSGQPNALFDLLYHHLALEPEAGFAAWSKTFEARRQRYDQEGLLILLTIPALPERWHILPRAAQARWHFHSGMLALFQDRLGEAEVCFGRALLIFQELKERLGEANTQEGLGDLYQRQERLEEAAVAYGHALELYKELEAYVGQANTLKGLGDLYLRQAFLSKAAEAYDDALTIYKQINARRGEANTLRRLGDLYQQQNRLSEAESFYTSALQLYQQIDDQGGQANTLKGLGNLYQRQHHLSKAESSYKHALLIYQQLDLPLGKANALKGLGDLHQQQNRLSEAEAAYEDAQAIYKEINDRRGEAYTLRSMGRFHSHSGNIEGAEQDFAQALSLFEKMDDLYNIVATLTQRGQHRLNHDLVGGLEDWGIALPLSLAVHVPCFQTTNHLQWNDLLRHLERHAYHLLDQGVPLFVQIIEQGLAQLPFNEEQQGALALFRDAFLVVGAIATTHVTKDQDEREYLTDFARQQATTIDAASDAMLGLTALVEAHL